MPEMFNLIMVMERLLTNHTATCSFCITPSPSMTPQTSSILMAWQAILRFTTDQRNIYHKDLRRMLGSQNTIRTMAYALTGKITRLGEMCRRNPAIKFLLVVFNKSVEIHSKKVFPPNVTLKTANTRPTSSTTSPLGLHKEEGVPGLQLVPQGCHDHGGPHLVLKQ